jgi:ABC-type branched-subunit amino acid transport system permease subunit
LAEDVTRLSSRGIGLAVLAVAGLVVVPSIVGTYKPVWINGLVQLIIFASLALVVWTSGQISLGHAAFVAVGATTMAHLLNNQHLPWGVALVASGLVAVPVGAFVAVPAIRLSGIYLALATLGFGILMQNVVYPTSLMFSYTLSVTARRPEFGPFHGVDDRHFYYLALAIAACSLAAIAFVARSRLGRLLRAMAETPTMLSTLGLSVNVTRLIVFCISAFFAGIAGALQVSQLGSVTGTSYGPLQSLTFLAILAVAGTRLLRSSIRAAFAVAVAPAYLANVKALDFVASPERQTLLFGLAAIVAAVLIARREAVARWIARRSAASAGRAPAARAPRSRRGESDRSRRGESEPASVGVHSGAGA